MELKELALRIRRGDREALKALISEYGVGVYQKAYRKTQDKALAREATRQTFAQLVTALQSQTDMDGWELWLNALAKRNIETYSNIGSDMAFLENQLNQELFPSGEQAAHGAVSQTATQFALQQQQEAQQAQARLLQQQEAQQAQARLQQQQAQALAKQQYEVQQAQLRMQQQYEAQQAQLRMQQQQQYEARQAQLRIQQQQQYEAQQAQLRLKQYEAQLAAQQSAPEAAAQQPAPGLATQQPVETTPLVQPNGLVEAAPALPEETLARREKLRKRRDKRTPGSAWPVIVLLTLLCILLVWLVVGVVMSFGWLPKVDIGYEWFNEHILELF